MVEAILLGILDKLLLVSFVLFNYPLVKELGIDIADVAVVMLLT